MLYRFKNHHLSMRKRCISVQVCLIIDWCSSVLTSNYVNNNAVAHAVVLPQTSLGLRAYNKQEFAKKWMLQV